MGTKNRNATLRPSLPATGPVLGSAVAAVIATIAMAIATAASAGATATRLGAEPGISFGSATNYGTGCTYALNGRVDDPVTPVVFYDNGIPFATVVPSGSLAQAHWTPATPGPHHLQIVQPAGAGADVMPYVDLFVGTGTLTGSGCIVFH